jgi:hypothetical protein
MNKLVYICMPNEFVIGDVVLKSFINKLAVAMVNKTSSIVYVSLGLQSRFSSDYMYTNCIRVRECVHILTPS